LPRQKRCACAGHNGVRPMCPQTLELSNSNEPEKEKRLFHPGFRQIVAAFGWRCQGGSQFLTSGQLRTLNRPILNPTTYALGTWIVACFDPRQFWVPCSSSRSREIPASSRPPSNPDVPCDTGCSRPIPVSKSRQPRLGLLSSAHKQDRHTYSHNAICRDVSQSSQSRQHVNHCTDLDAADAWQRCESRPRACRAPDRKFCRRSLRSRMVHVSCTYCTGIGW
jgi:hypothetical protein